MYLDGQKIIRSVISRNVFTFCYGKNLPKPFVYKQKSFFHCSIVHYLNNIIRFYLTINLHVNLKG